MTAIGDWFSFLRAMLTISNIIVTPSPTTPIRIQDPAQAWMPITVGAYTNCVQFSQEQFGDCRPLAQAGDLSPSSTTSLSWFREWSIKPDIVLEGGNLVIHPDSQRIMDPINGLLTTVHNAVDASWCRSVVRVPRPLKLLGWLLCCRRSILNTGPRRFVPY